LEAGSFSPSWMVDGVHPGNEVFSAFRDRAIERGWRIWAQPHLDLIKRYRL
jgi:hypothetical protein